MKSTREQELAVLRSVVYASLFDYPLEPAQLESSLIGVRADAADDRSLVARKRPAAGGDRIPRRPLFPGRAVRSRSRTRSAGKR